MAETEQGTTDREHWERNAHAWAGFTRGPEPDAYPNFAPRFFEFLPPPGGQALEVGCGEGRVTRDLRARGYEVVSIDGSPTMIELARAADPDGTYLVADAGTLPFEDRSFDLVVAYNVLMDVDDLPGVVREAARVLAPDGRLAACVTHPLADAGQFAERSADAPFVIEGSYLGSRRFEAVYRRNGIDMPFAGWAHPLEAYFEAFEAAGLVVEAMREPASTPEMVERDPAEARWARVPNFLLLRLRHSTAAPAQAVTATHWVRWHERYDADTPYARRLAIVQRWIRDVVSGMPAGQIRIVSMCAGDGRDLVGALDGHARRADVEARLVELDPTLARRAIHSIEAIGLRAAVRQADAGVTTNYEGAVPADLILACGVFGNVSDADIAGTIAALPRLAAPGAIVIWTRHRREPDATPAIRRWFAGAGFQELMFEPVPDSLASVGVHRLVGPPLPFESGLRFFEFLSRD